ncbi:MAG: hypothetical protein F4Y80_09085 [Caldilineaceae bacterium SB0665_bin_21]|nr:hypothetical protein [Caldilineaceae bacterium SB0665_bin_21]
MPLTLGPEWDGFDFRGIALIGTWQRGALCLHLYLAAGDCGGGRIQACWLARSAPTGALPHGRDCEAMPLEAAAITYAVRYHSMRSRQSGDDRGRHWQVIDSAGIEAHSAPRGWAASPRGI